MSQVQEAQEKAELVVVDAQRQRSAIDAITITCNDEAKRVAELGKACATARKTADEKRDELVRPLNETVKKINELFRPGIEALRAVEAAAKDKVIAWESAERKRVAAENAEREQREAAEREQREAAEREQREAAERAAKAGNVADALAAAEDQEAARIQAEEAEAKRKEALQAPIAQPASTAHAATGGMMKSRGTWTAKITDPDAVPRKYCSPDDGLLRAALKVAKDAGLLSVDAAGEPIINYSIPGVAIEYRRGGSW